MATELKKAIVRKTQGTIRNGSAPRALVITLYPGDIIGLRENGRRKKSEECISIQSVYQYAIRCRVAKQRMEKGKEKKAKRKTR